MTWLNTECPNCLEENAYFNGVEYECPDCDYTWRAIDEADVEEMEDED